MNIEDLINFIDTFALLSFCISWHLIRLLFGAQLSNSHDVELETIGLRNVDIGLRVESLKC